MHRPPPRKANQGKHQSWQKKKQQCRPFHKPFQSLTCLLHSSCLRASLSIPVIKGANLVELKRWTIWILTLFSFSIPLIILQLNEGRRKSAFVPHRVFGLYYCYYVIKARSWLDNKERIVTAVSSPRHHIQLGTELLQFLALLALPQIWELKAWERSIPTRQ